jgi:ATP-dependent RNA helicase DeaD
MAQGDGSLMLRDKSGERAGERSEERGGDRNDERPREHDGERGAAGRGSERPSARRGARGVDAPHAPAGAHRDDDASGAERAPPRHRSRGGKEEPQATYRLEVGRQHGVQPGNIVGALAHEADLDGSQINGIKIYDDHTLVRLPADLPIKVLAKLRRIKVRGQMLDISRVESAGRARSREG